MNEIMQIAGTELTIRPIRITDADRLVRMFGRLSPETVHFRFFATIPRIPRPVVLRFANVDHCRREALVALDRDEIVAVARYDAQSQPAGGAESREAEIAVTVEDAWQHRGLGRRLTRRLAALARARGYDAFVATILPDNRAALALVRDLAPEANVRFVGGDYEARLPLTA